jgi:TolA-binding protein
MKQLLVLSVAVALAASSATAFAQKHTYSGRVDNIWNGFAHQPTEAQVTQQEQSAGLGQSQQQKKAANDNVESMYQALMHDTDAQQ